MFSPKLNISLRYEPEINGPYEYGSFLCCFIELNVVNYPSLVNDLADSIVSALTCTHLSLRSDEVIPIKMIWLVVKDKKHVSLHSADEWQATNLP